MAIPYEHRGEGWDMGAFTPKEKLDEVDKELAVTLNPDQPTEAFVPETASERILAEMIEPDEAKVRGIGSGLKASMKWKAHFDNAEKANNLPTGSLIAIAAIESGGNPKVGSSAGAVGLMQFMPATAREMGLRVDDTVDERLDPAKSIKAAGRYFSRQVNASGGDLFQALMKYNWGSGNVYGWNSNPSRTMPMETRQYLGRWKAAMRLQSELEAGSVSSAP